MSPVPFVGDARRLDTERSVQPLVRGMIGRVTAGTAEAEFGGIFFRKLDEVRKRLDRTLIAHHQRIRRVVEPEHRRHVIGLVLTWPSSG
jgi:hypothetical protein